MKKRKKEILAIVMVTLMLMLAACGNTQEENDTPTNKPNVTEASTSNERNAARSSQMDAQ